MPEAQDPNAEDLIDQLLDEAEALADLERAMPLYERALALDPDRAAVHYNLGLVHKYRHAWAESLRHNRRASELRPDDEASHWNMGIAATALRDWLAAREAWQRAGIAITDGEGPIEEDFGITPVRLNPDAKAEVVWGRRIDPVRVVLENIPYPDSGFRAGDVVLHDGAPVGERLHQGHTYSVFNVLELFESSANSTFEAEVRTRDAADLLTLTEALNAAQLDHEVWTSNVRVLCRQCSEGTPHEHSDEEPAEALPVWPDRHVIGISSTAPEPVRQVLDRWKSGMPGLAPSEPEGERLLRFECMLAGVADH